MTGKWRKVEISTGFATAILVLYLISVGPFWRLRGGEPGAVETWQIAYAPIDWVCRRSNSIADMFTRYVDKWLRPDGFLPTYQDGELTVVSYRIANAQYFRQLELGQQPE